MKIVDIKEMPRFNAMVKDNIDSVSRRDVFLGNPIDFLEPYAGAFRNATKLYPCCTKHGAMNQVSKDGIWRCIMCGAGCYEVTS